MFGLDGSFREAIVFTNGYIAATPEGPPTGREGWDRLADRLRAAGAGRDAALAAVTDHLAGNTGGRGPEWDRTPEARAPGEVRAGTGAAV
ncbi:MULTISPECIES: hypothetical protein [unclassified Nocardiopsis]|uniref:hypothetical protein n=1 Tax=Nocardiopsis TaxID=2013 RepID=UPI00387B2DE6